MTGVCWMHCDGRTCPCCRCETCDAPIGTCNCRTYLQRVYDEEVHP